MNDVAHDVESHSMTDWRQSAVQYQLCQFGQAVLTDMVLNPTRPADPATMKAWLRPWVERVTRAALQGEIT